MADTTADVRAVSDIAYKYCRAYQLAKVDYGELENWGLNKTDTGAVDEDGLKILDNSGREKIAQILAKYLNGATITETPLFVFDTYSLTKEKLGPVGVFSSEKMFIQLNNGMWLGIGYVAGNSWNPDIDIALYTDSKENKQQGVDLFYFTINDRGVFPAGDTKLVNNYSFSEDCNIAVQNNRQNGRGCTAWIVQEGNMNYLHCSGLELDGSKKKCN